MNYYKVIITETVEKEILIKAHCPFEAQIFAEAIVDKTDVLDLFEDLETNIYIDIQTLDEHFGNTEYIDDEHEISICDFESADEECETDDFEEGYYAGYDYGYNKGYDDGIVETVKSVFVGNIDVEQSEEKEWCCLTEQRI